MQTLSQNQAETFCLKISDNVEELQTAVDERDQIPSFIFAVETQFIL